MARLLKSIRDLKKKINPDVVRKARIKALKIKREQMISVASDISEYNTKPWYMRGIYMMDTRSPRLHSSKPWYMED